MQYSLQLTAYGLQLLCYGEKKRPDASHRGAIAQAARLPVHYEIVVRLVFLREATRAIRKSEFHALERLEKRLHDEELVRNRQIRPSKETDTYHVLLLAFRCSPFYIREE